MEAAGRLYAGYGEAADRFYAERLKAQFARTDANDMLY